jgi:geranylgeranyl reductase family protein
MKESCNIAVIGAGPAGCSAALEACRLGLGPVLLLDRARWPRPKTCGGGISPRARAVLSEMGVWPQVEREAYQITGLRLVGSNGRGVVLSGAEDASVLNRRRLDWILAEAAAGAGAGFLPGTRVTGIKRLEGGLLGVRADGGEIAARWVVAADGSRARFGSGARTGTILHTAVASFEGVPFSPHILEMIFDQGLAPHYGWLFPESATRVNIGICTTAEKLGRRSITDLLGGFLEKHYARRLGGAVQDGDIEGHPISTSTTIRHNAPDGVLLAGEAAGLANIATGEGISYALESGRLAARAISRGEKAGEPQGVVARAYEKDLRRAMGRGLWAAGLFRRYGTGAVNVVTTLGNTGIIGRFSGRAMARL